MRHACCHNTCGACTMDTHCRCSITCAAVCMPVLCFYILRTCQPALITPNGQKPCNKLLPTAHHHPTSTAYHHSLLHWHFFPFHPSLQTARAPTCSFVAAKRGWSMLLPACPGPAQAPPQALYPFPRPLSSTFPWYLRHATQLLCKRLQMA
jgi:hypothetical protein